MSSDANNRAVHFPPQKLSDLVLHYLDVDFHVHKFVLHHHSTVLDSIIDAVMHDSEADSKQPTKRQRTCGCNKPCYRFEPMTAKLYWSKLISAPQDSHTVSAEAMELFFRHLYFPDHYCYPPLLPAVDVDLTTPPPFVTTYSTPVDAKHISHLKKQVTPIPFKHFTASDGRIRYVQATAVMYLAFYFGAETVLKRCQDILRDQTKRYGEAWYYLPVAEEYKWDALKEDCIRTITSNSDMLTTSEYVTAKKNFPKLAVDVLEHYWRSQHAASTNSRSAMGLQSVSIHTLSNVIFQQYLCNSLRSSHRSLHALFQLLLRTLHRIKQQLIYLHIQILLSLRPRITPRPATALQHRPLSRPPRLHTRPHIHHLAHLHPHVTAHTRHIGQQWQHSLHAAVYDGYDEDVGVAGECVDDELGGAPAERLEADTGPALAFWEYLFTQPVHGIHRGAFTL